MNPLVLTFDHSGTGSCLYSELIDLTQIGALQIRRASTIEFNNDTQRWEVKNLKGKVVIISKFRGTCLAWERENLTANQSPIEPKRLQSQFPSCR
jgi:hypothetical protein